MTGSMSRGAKLAAGRTAKDRAEVMNQRFNRPVRRAQRARTPAANRLAAEAADIRHQFDGAPSQRQIRDLTLVSAVNAANDVTAARTLARRRCAADQIVARSSATDGATIVKPGGITADGRRAFGMALLSIWNHRYLGF